MLENGPIETNNALEGKTMTKQKEATFASLSYGDRFIFKNNGAAVYRKYGHGLAILNGGCTHEPFKCHGNTRVERVPA